MDIIKSKDGDDGKKNIDNKSNCANSHGYCKGLKAGFIMMFGILTLGFSIISTVTPYSISIFDASTASATTEGNGGGGDDEGDSEEPSEEEEPPSEEQPPEEEEPTPTEPTIVEEPTTQELCPEGTTGTPPNCEPVPPVPLEENATTTGAPVPTTPAPTTAPVTDIAIDPFDPVNGIAEGKQILNPYEPVSTAVPYIVVDPLQPVNGLTDTNAPINTLVDYAEACCNIANKAFEPAVQENIYGIAKQFAAVDPITGETTNIEEQDNIAASNSEILEQVVLRAALKGGDPNLITDTIAQTVQEQPYSPLSKAIYNVAKESSQFNNAIDVGATQIANGVPPAEAFEQLDLYSGEPCCIAGQPQTTSPLTSTPTATPAVDPFEPVNGLTDTNAPINTLVDYAEPCCGIANKALDSTLKQKVNSVAENIANNPEIASAAGATTPESQQNLAGSVSDVLEQLVIRAALKGGDATQFTDALTEAVEQDPGGIISQILSLNAAKENAQINAQTDLIAGQIAQGGSTESAG